MALPKQVVAQMAALEELEKQMAAQQDQPQVDEVVPAATTEAVPPDIAPPEAAAVVVPDQPKEVKAGEDWEHLYKTIKGRYDTDVPRLHQDVKQLKTQMEQMSFDFEKNRIVREEQALLDADNKAMREENAQLREQMQRTSNDMSTMSFEKRLHRAVSDFETINDNPAWVTWLDQVDPLLRAPRRVVAQQAFDSEDVEAISDYVTMFKQTLPTAKVDNRASLEAQVAPSRTGSSGSGTTSQAKIYTAAQADAVFAKMTSLNMKGDYDGAAKLDVEISSAYAEGRVRN